MTVRGIREREDDGPLNLAGHFANHRLGKSAGHGREANEDRRADVVDDVREADLIVASARPIRDAAPGLREECAVWG